MDPDTQAAMDEIAREWLEARDIIAIALKELILGASDAHIEHNAAAIIARLSHAGFAVTKVIS